MADRTPLASFRYHAAQLIIALKHVGNRNVSLGLRSHLGELATSAKALGIATPVEIETTPYPEGVTPLNPFLSDRWEGRCIIRFPEGSEERGSVAHEEGADLLVEARQSAIVALQQWLAFLEHFCEGTSSAGKPGKRSKRSTERGEGHALLIANLTKHHQYADGGCLNLEPIGNNELAKAAGVSQSTASAFFKKEFKGHAKYRAICQDARLLANALKMLNGEFAPHILYEQQPAGEDVRDDE